MLVSLMYAEVKKEFYPNGKLKAEVLFKNGKAEGIGKGYYENGNLNIEITYNNNKAIKGYMYDTDGRKTKMTNAHFKKTGIFY